MRIGVDMDGVLANWVDSYAEKIVEVTGENKFSRTPLTSEHWLSWDYDLDCGYSLEQRHATFQAAGEDRHFWSMLKTYPTALDDIVYLMAAEREGHDVYFITNRSGVDAKYQTETWFRKQTAYRFNPTVLIASDKGIIAQGLKLDAYIDDNLQNCRDVKVRSGAATFLMGRPWNVQPMSDYVRAGSPDGAIWVVNQVRGIVHWTDNIKSPELTGTVLGRRSASGALQAAYRPENPSMISRIRD